ncbi:MAG: hypothetical protein M0C28_35965 [Candidatus Moduliflexus flocculans]|nr:hypothetical protein [Candidatus Moduliflexus flocculans]
MAGIKRRIEDEFGLAPSNPVHPGSSARPSTASATSSRTSWPPSAAGAKKALKFPDSAIMRDPGSGRGAAW